MADRQRVLKKIDDLNSYLQELKKVKPAGFVDYKAVEKKRSCERILQLCIECAIDICKLIVAGYKFGVPSEENDLFEKLYKNGVIDEEMCNLLKEMRGFRNILVHEYAEVDDEIVFKTADTGLKDFERFKTAVLEFVKHK